MVGDADSQEMARGAVGLRGSVGIQRFGEAWQGGRRMRRVGARTDVCAAGRVRADADTVVYGNERGQYMHMQSVETLSVDCGLCRSGGWSV